jgi:lipopolysaccharide exporter
MLKLIHYLKSSHFVRNMSVVMSGTAVAQVIGFTLTPIIGRLFSPSDFGVFGSFYSVLTVIAAGVALQYSQAIMLPKQDEDAANVFAVSMLSVFVITLVGLLSAYVFSDWLLGLLKAPDSKWLLWFLPLGVFVSGINQSFQAWCIRRKAFKKTASSQMIRAGAVGTLQIVSGLFRHGGGGLIASSVAADGMASLNLARQVFCTDKVLLKSSLAWKRIGRLAVEYRDFPVYSATQNMMNALSNALPVLLLGYYYGVAVAGAYAFGVRILQAPMGFVLVALRQVLFQKASETYNHGGKLYPLYIKTTGGLFAMAIIPAIILSIWAPSIFALIFGSKWYEAGVYARWLILWVMVLFCNLPSSLFAAILRQQRNLFFYEFVILLSRTSALVAGGLLLSAKGTIILFSVVGCLLNVFYILWIGCLVKKKHSGIGTGK